MVKQKLLQARISKGLSQEAFADLMGMTQSNYSRSENGITKISNKEWDKIAKVLETSLNEIYEPDVGVIVNGDHVHGNFGADNTINFSSDFYFETMKKYIQKLEVENQALKNQLNK